MIPCGRARWAATGREFRMKRLHSDDGYVDNWRTVRLSHRPKRQELSVRKKQQLLVIVISLTAIDGRGELPLNCCLANLAIG